MNRTVLIVQNKLFTSKVILTNFEMIPYKLIFLLEQRLIRKFLKCKSWTNNSLSKGKWVEGKLSEGHTFTLFLHKIHKYSLFLYCVFCAWPGGAPSPLDCWNSFKMFSIARAAVYICTLIVNLKLRSESKIIVVAHSKSNC